jgi:L-methionine (R)-S-oxide reductase
MTPQAWLEQFLADHRAIAGTVHRRNGDDLELIAAVNIPPPVQEIVKRVPRGKGMAGLAFERSEPVSTCNIQTDATGQVRPGAKLVGAQAGVALPVLDAQGQVRAVVGLAYKEERTILESELVALLDEAGGVPS